MTAQVLQTILKVAVQLAPKQLGAVKNLTTLLEQYGTNPLLNVVEQVALEASATITSTPAAAINNAKRLLGPDLEIIHRALKGKDLDGAREILSDAVRLIEKGQPLNKERLIQLLEEIKANHTLVDEQVVSAHESAEKLLDGSIDNLMKIFQRELENSGSILGMARKAAQLFHRFLPGQFPEKWQWVLDETKMKEHIKEKVLNEDFRSFLIDYVRGTKVSTNDLQGLQKMCFKGFQGALWFLRNAPKEVIEFAPAVGTGLGFFARRIPFFGFINMALMFLGNYQDELQEIKGLSENFRTNP
ncbi:MAG: hypothetical protein HYY52_08855 [Candidatus Melainabacteria bacterium]|nr:hypothetical protein [Candidatus Melainabacteria bacterium]